MSHTLHARDTQQLKPPYTNYTEQWKPQTYPACTKHEIWQKHSLL